VKEYRLTVQRRVSVIATIIVDGTDEASAIARFQHQLENESCPGIEDAEMWGEVFYYQIDKAGPYVGEYEVIDAEEIK